MPYDLHVLILFRLVVGTMNACKPPQSTRVKHAKTLDFGSTCVLRRNQSTVPRVVGPAFHF